jgi:hypothetical protein
MGTLLAMVGNEDWIMILGDDDTIDSNCVALFIKIDLIERKNCKVIRYATQVIDQNDLALSGIYAS